MQIGDYSNAKMVHCNEEIPQNSLIFMASWKAPNYLEPTRMNSFFPEATVIRAAKTFDEVERIVCSGHSKFEWV